MKKLNNKGISELIIALIVVVIGVAAFGTYKLVDSSAARKVKVGVFNGKIYKKGSDSIISITVKTSSKKDFKNMKASIDGKKAIKNNCQYYMCSFNVHVKGNIPSGYHATKVKIANKTVYNSKTYYKSR